MTPPSVQRLLRLACNGQRGIATAAMAAAKDNTGFFGSFFDRKIEVQQSAHSDKLTSAKEEIIELQTHNVRPDSREAYLRAHRELVAYFAANKATLHCEALGNFRVFVGDEDQYIHLWRYDDGYKGIDNTLAALYGDKEYQAIRKEIVPLLRNRHSQYLMNFSYWPEVHLRQGRHIYEVRSYHLKPGTMVEWGNYWARAIRLRDHKASEAFMGLFSQVGELYNVKHIWCYDSLDERKRARESVWQKEQEKWGEIVANTVPLIRQMTSRIMRPLPHSPSQ